MRELFEEHPQTLLASLTAVVNGCVRIIGDEVSSSQFESYAVFSILSGLECQEDSSRIHGMVASSYSVCKACSPFTADVQLKLLITERPRPSCTCVITVHYFSADSYLPRDSHRCYPLFGFAATANT